MLKKLLPWERNQNAHLENLLDELRERDTPLGMLEMVQRAFYFAEKAHQGQHRKSGEEYLWHPYEVAYILAAYELDEQTIAAALLHDVLEDTAANLEIITEEFGEEVAALVDGLTKLDAINFQSTAEAEAASMRKMMVAVAKDIRVLFIKLADRLHNMKTLAVLSRARQQDIASETLKVYAPLANRLGMQELASQLEDMAFAALHSKWYSEIDNMVEIRSPEREIYLTQIATQVEEKLAENKIKAEVLRRPKHLWSIYKKMSGGRNFDDIYDLSGLRVILENVSDCYAALGHIHSMWQFLPGRFKDHIAIPKFNLYQSLHTTVMGPAGYLIEIQIRTQDMDDRAERGIAAHWSYKENEGSDLAWLDRIMDWVEDTSHSTESMTSLQSDLEQDEVFVFTPKGDLISLPHKSTPVDFAYAIHTDMGNAARGAVINGQLSPLSTPLESGDTVEIIVSTEGETEPLLEWLEFAISRKARNMISKWHLKTGEDIPGASAQGANLKGSKKEGEREGEKEEADGGEGQGIPAENCSILVEGQDDIWVRLANCCKPRRTDEILGFVTRGKGVSVHTSECENVVFLSRKEPSRFIQVEWDERPQSGHRAELEIRALDRFGLLKDVLDCLPPQIFIHSTESKTEEGGVAHIKFEVEMGDRAQAETILKSIKQVDSVYDVFLIS